MPEEVVGASVPAVEFEAVLEGGAGRGINLRRMFEAPGSFDPWLIAQGSAILPYLEDGETVSLETAFTILMPTEGGLSATSSCSTEPQSRRSSLMPVLERVFSSTRFTITAQ